MATRGIDRLKRTVTGAVTIGRQVGESVVRTAVPLVTHSARTLRRKAAGERTVPARPSVASPAPVAQPEIVVEHEAVAPTKPTPAAVAKNIARHPPAAKKKPAKKAAPGAKLPARKPPTETAERP